MSVAKTIELSCSSPEGFDHAVMIGVARARKTIDQIRDIRIGDQTIIFLNGAVDEFRVNMLVTFVLDES